MATFSNSHAARSNSRLVKASLRAGPSVALRAPVGTTNPICRPERSEGPALTQSELKSHPRARKNGELRDRAAGRTISVVVVEIHEDVLRVVRVRDAEIRRHLRSAVEIIARDVEIETVIGGIALAVVSAAERLDEDLRVTGAPSVGGRIIDPPSDTADDWREGSSSGETESCADAILRERPSCHDVQV